MSLPLCALPVSGWPVLYNGLANLQRWATSLLSCGSPQKGQAPRTVNRYVRSVVAALNGALDDGYVGNPGAWRLKALADDVESERNTAVSLSAPRRKAIIAAASPEVAPFLRGLELTGVRPMVLSSASIGDFDGEALRLAHCKGLTCQAF
jgi:hypothetical protein